MSDVPSRTTLEVSKRVALRWAMVFGLVVGGPSVAGSRNAEPGLARISVYKDLPLLDNTNQGDATQKALSIAESFGFEMVADYSSRTLVKGPSAKAAGLLKGLADAGFQSEPATDLDSFSFHDAVVDADFGLDASKALDDGGGIYFVTLDGYPLDGWLVDLATQVDILQPAGSAAYVVEGKAGTASTLRAKFPWIRGVFKVDAKLKPYGFTWSYPDPSPFRPTIVRASGSLDGLDDFLSSASPDSFTRRVDELGRPTFETLLSDVDIQSVAQFGSVFEILPQTLPTLSAERPAQLIASSGTGATLPGTNSPTYVSWLGSKGLGVTNASNRFYNTTVGVIDTGFDNLNSQPITYANIHPDFRFIYQGTQIPFVIAKTTGWPSIWEDRDNHGTVVASIISGYPDPSRTESPTGYQYGLGVAPSVRLVTEKFFNCFVAAASLPASIDRVVNAGANVINMSFNDPANQGACDYNATSILVDSRTQTGKLFIVAAGNSPEGCAGNYVRSPANGKNIVAVGSTDNYTLSSWANLSTDNTCAWNNFPATQDARRIPSYSAKRKPNSVVKPDLVAPGTRVTGPQSRGASACGSALFCNPNIASFTIPDAVTYGMAAGTSFSAPQATGAAAVVRRWYLDLKAASPSPAMTKALLILGARDIAGTIVRNESFGTVATIQGIPDPYQGWGMLSFQRLLGTAASNRYYFFDQGVSLTNAAPVWTKNLTVQTLTDDVQVTLTWTDPPSVGNSTYVALNDLKLTVCGPINTTRCFQGNYFNGVANQPSYSYPRPPGILYNDPINNVDRVRIKGASLTGSAITVEVRAINVTQGSQNFAIAVENAHE